jgi:hypothetical protein
MSNTPFPKPLTLPLAPEVVVFNVAPRCREHPLDECPDHIPVNAGSRDQPVDLLLQVL